ncbi:hypothetical protein TIFTF001_035470 [Ficus carica]|uniref:Uncharacterized protein n=1 Tax=Ficus carica TaxID=3494 RepID=A0AA88E2B9_FICCA|nr:hypothetical protein TIFTF001_035470 [Ficus carica]
MDKNKAQGGNLQLYSEKSSTTQDIAREVNNLSTMLDTRWKGVAGHTVKCGRSSCYAFCSLRIYRLEMMASPLVCAAVTSLLADAAVASPLTGATARREKEIFDR